MIIHMPVQRNFIDDTKKSMMHNGLFNIPLSALNVTQIDHGVAKIWYDNDTAIVQKNVKNVHLHSST